MNHASKALATVLVASIFLLLYACGGGGGDGSTDATTEATTVATTEATTIEAGAEDLANAVIATWSDSMQQLVALLEEKPEASSVMSEVQALKESTIQSLVALGHQRQSLSTGEKAEMDSLLRSAMFGLSEEDWYTSYSELWSYYAAGDIEFGNILAAFNILTQYSDFELLKKQLPDEAARLGVE